MRCLFVTHKWGDAAPDTGESVTIPHLIETFDEWGKGERHAVWTDEVWDEGRDIARELSAAAAEFRPDTVVFTPIPSALPESQNVSPALMRKFSCPVISVFFDLAHTQVRTISRPYADASELCINVDGDQTPIGTRFLPLGAARTARQPREKTIDICFLGARERYADRTASLERLADAGIQVTVFGSRQEQLRGLHGDTRPLPDRVELQQDTQLLIAIESARVRGSDIPVSVSVKIVVARNL